MTTRILVLALSSLCLGSLNVHAQDEAPVSPSDVAEVQSCLQSAGDDPRSCAGQQSDRCMSTPEGQSTVRMGECIMNEQAVWDRLLNDRYNAAVSAAKAMDQSLTDRFEPDVFSTLQKAQRAWIAYRDAECDRLYAYWKDGTIRTTTYASCMLDLTAERAIDLAGMENAG